jgi:tetratricopeptide (TPR) repeat protein
VTLKKGKSRLIQTISKSGLGDLVQPGLAQTVPACRSFVLKDWLFVIALIAAVFLAYEPAWQGGFIWDDDYFVTSPELQSWYGLFRIWFDPGATLGYYPLLHSAFWIQYWLWGNATLGYHLVNIMLHATAAVMVALILRQLAIPGAFLAAAIFALHPVCVESVAWISELKNTLSAVFYLGSVMTYLHFDQPRRMPLYLWSLGLFVLAMLSKPVTVTLPAALLVIFWWQRGRLSWRKDVLPLLPFFLLGAVGAIFTIWTQHFITGTDVPDFANPALERVLIAGKVIWFYLGKLFWPVKLIFIYPRWETSQAAAWQYLFPAGAIALLVALWSLRHRWRGPLAGVLFFVGTLFPVLGFFNIFTFVYSFVADHYQYLASLGIITLFAAGIATFLKRLQIWRRPIGYAICVLLLLTLGALTWSQSRMYTDIKKLYQTTIDLNPTCWLAYNNRGVIYGNLGQYRRAIEDYNEAIRLKPDYAFSYGNRGVVYGNLGQYKRAIEDYNEALRLKPNSPVFYYNRGNSYQELGQYQLAIEDYNEALRLNPKFSAAYVNRQNIYPKLIIRQYQQAIEGFNEAIRLKPNDADAYNNRGVVYTKLSQYQTALDDFSKAIRLKPDYADAHNNRGIVYFTQGNNKPGCFDAQKACELGNCKTLEIAKAKRLCH